MEALQRWISDFLNILTRRQPFGWNNVLDVLIVAVFVYYVLLLIRGTRAVQLLIGVMVLVLIYFVASYLHLTLTTLLLQALFAVALIALVVVFQPELRRALGQIGQLGPLNRLLAPGSEEELEGIVDELVRAALLISEAKHGALIVLERATGLQDYSETGVPVNGKLTAELLASIFMTRSPLHGVLAMGRVPVPARPLLRRRHINLRRVVTADLPLKLTAVLIAMIFWAVSALSAPPTEVVRDYGGRVAVERPDDVPAGYVLE